MKPATFILLVTIIVSTLVVSSGCKPKQVTVSGQVFIVTQGADNIKLGDVEVLLIEKQQVPNLLQQRQAILTSAIEGKKQAGLDAHRAAIDSAKSKIAALQVDVTNDLQLVQNVQEQFNQAKVVYDQFMAAQPLRTNAVFLKIKKDLATQTALIPSQQDTIRYLEKQVNRSYQPQTWVLDYTGVNGTSGHWAGATAEQFAEQIRVEQNHLAEVKTDLANTFARIDADKRALEQIEQDVNGFQSNKLQIVESALNAAKSRLTETQSRLITAESNLNALDHQPPFIPSPLTADDYFTNFSPAVVQKKITDPDGKFSFAYPRKKAFTIFASARRAVMDKTEKYYWILDAPNSAETVQLLLSNNNLVYNDPDNYFEVKPVRQ